MGLRNSCSEQHCAQRYRETLQEAPTDAPATALKQTNANRDGLKSKARLYEKALILQGFRHFPPAQIRIGMTTYR